MIILRSYIFIIRYTLPFDELSVWLFEKGKRTRRDAPPPKKGVCKKKEGSPDFFMILPVFISKDSSLLGGANSIVTKIKASVKCQGYDLGLATVLSVSPFQ